MTYEIGRYLSDEDLRGLSDSDLSILVIKWRGSLPAGYGMKKIVAHANMGAPLLQEVERRWIKYWQQQ